jgi:aminoglycoside phosphotransferase (APT) family kinase protein
VDIPRALTLDELPQEVRSSLGRIKRLSYPQQGCTSDSAIAESEHGTYLIKRSRGPQFSAWLAQEYRVLAALAASPLPVPRPHHFLRRNTPPGAEAWLVMDCLPGASLRTVLQGDVSPATRSHLLRAFGQVLAAIHATPAPPDLTPTDRPWLDRMLDMAAYNLAHFPVDGSQDLLEHLQGNRPADVPATLIHGDFTLDNVLVAGNAISGVIDWSGGDWGDPRYDLALAIRPEPEAFGNQADLQAFFEGYGRRPLSDDEYRYFNGLYEFF